MIFILLNMDTVLISVSTADNCYENSAGIDSFSPLHCKAYVHCN